MAIGLKYGRCAVDDMESKNKSKELCVEYYERFKTENGSCICRELRDSVVGDAEEMLCPKLVQSATKIALDIMDIA